MTNKKNEWDLDDLFGGGSKPAPVKDVQAPAESPSDSPADPVSADLDFLLTGEPTPAAPAVEVTPETVEQGADGDSLLNAETQAELIRLKDEAVAGAKRFGRNAWTMTGEGVTRVKDRIAVYQAKKSEQAKAPKPEPAKRSVEIVRRVPGNNMKSVWIGGGSLLLIVALVAAIVIPGISEPDTAEPKDQANAPVQDKPKAPAPKPKAQESKPAKPVDAPAKQTPPPVPTPSKTEQQQKPDVTEASRSDRGTGGVSQSPKAPAKQTPPPAPSPSKTEQQQPKAPDKSRSERGAGGVSKPEKPAAKPKPKPAPAPTQQEQELEDFFKEIDQ